VGETALLSRTVKYGGEKVSLSPLLVILINSQNLKNTKHLNNNNPGATLGKKLLVYTIRIMYNYINID
jgi:hypothetical protein